MATGKFGQKEALTLIEDMVNQGRYKLEEEAKYFLIWGWMVFAAAVLQFIGIQLELELIRWVWPVFMSIAFIVYVWMAIRSNREKRASTYVDRLNKHLWRGIAGPIAIAILIGFMHSWQSAFPFFMGIYGWGALVSGGILRFKPLVIGGIISILTGIVAVFVSGEHLLLLLALAIFAGFIFPGHSLKRIKK